MGELIIQRVAVIGNSGKDEMILRLIERFDRAQRQCKAAVTPPERFEDADLSFMFAVVEPDLGQR